MANQINLRKYADLQYDNNGKKNNGNSTPVYGPFEKLHLSDWGQSDIHHEIVQAFNHMNIKQIKPIQQSSFLYLMKHYNTAMIGFSKGKSVSYLASIYSSILSNSNDKVDSVVIGPKAIVLSSSLGSCSVLEDLSKKLCSSTNKKVNIVVAYESISVQHTIAALCNGCDILIGTPIGLHNLLTQAKIFSYSNLRHFVFDNIDLLLDNYETQMTYFYQILMKLKAREGCSIQLISASVKWNKEVDTFLKQLFLKWQYIFGSPLEAARYTKIGFNVVQVKDDKLEKILQLLESNEKCCQNVLVTSNADELGIISNYIQQHSSNIEVFVPCKMRISNVHTMQQWNEPLTNKQRLLICSDDMLIDFYVIDTDCLIHYDIPPDKHKFSMRFSVLQYSSNVPENKNRSTYIFLSNNIKDMLQLPKVVQIMKDFGNGEVDPILLKHAKNINDSLEKEKTNSLFCSELQQFGHCSKPMTCQSRHILFKQHDEPGVNIPRSGLAIVKILKVYDASHISAKLLKVNNTNNLNDEKHWSGVMDHSDTINSKLSSYFSKRNSEVLHENPKPGDIVAVQIESNSTRKIIDIKYFRALVINIVDKNTTNSKVRVKLIDEGCVETILKWKVFVLPDQLKSIPTTTVDMFLASVKPIGFDKTWYSHANNCVLKHLKDADTCNNTIIVKVKMALGTTIWIKKLYEKYWDTDSQKYGFGEILPEVLFNIGYADMNFEHIDNLRELSIAAGITKPLQLKMNVGENKELSVEEYMSIYKLPHPQWAHLDQSIILVSVESLISPKLFFVKNVKYYDRLNDLQLMIDKYVEENQPTKLKYVINGAICLAKYPQTNLYNRVKIIEKHVNGIVEVFFVDKAEFFNIKLHLLFTIHPDLITYLPFQAIECSLSGVKDILPTDNELNELVDYLFDITANPLYLKVTDIISSTTFTGGSLYEVILYDKSIIVNLEFQTKFSQYCDHIQMSTISTLINEEYNDIIEENDKDVPYIIDETKFDFEDSMHPEIVREFFNDFGTAIFGKDYANILKHADQDIQDIKKEDSLTITDITSSIENETLKENINIESVETNEIKSIDNIIPIKDICLLNNCKQKNGEKRRKICLTCNTNLQSIIPICTWHQDRNNIYLKLNILEIDDFNVDSTMESIKFKSKFKEFSYEFYVKLYGFIIDKSIIYRHNYEGFYIKAEKLFKTDYKWPQLFLCSKHHTYVKYDTEHVEIKDLGYIWIKTMNDLKLKAKGTPLNSLDNESFNSDSCSDNEEGYVFDDSYDLF
ncbi:putative ATP-dependent RNA helicase TDRD12 [Melanaphis sacchari]|uniref:RNA helicase n=1 Tax=Melanaphis sacchari TaxID=742174 RepID=A0A2H8TJS8_9HEMI|nr:putative ATP-dependent RNA helicase TDRD12 [Melanaphis sacchari]XP_025202132.1 putative ATP-dependent RNA helicase TDRD12 [Melanaphis sacchari]